MAQDEFSIIDRYFGSFPGFSAHAKNNVDNKTSARVIIGPGDDCAVLAVPAGHELCASTDTLLADVHFPATASASVIAQRTMAANLSDLAAMGACPHSFLLALTMPEVEETWLDEFTTRLRQLSSLYDIPLAGGNLCRGTLSLTMTVLGTAPTGTAITRSGARADNDIYVTGFIGDAGAGLKKYLGNLATQNPAAKDSATDDYLVRRYTQPIPRIEAGQALRRLATAMIDISDGLLADLRHLLDASGVGAEFDIDRIPISDELIAAPESEDVPLAALTSGDDYELCFTAIPGHRDVIQAVAETVGVKMTRIGTVTGETGIRSTRNGRLLQPESEGYNHFSPRN